MTQRILRLAASAALLAATIAAASPLDGTFALQGGTAKAAGFMRATTLGSNPLRQHLDIWMTPKSGGATITHYTMDMTKLLHLIVVSDDFSQFLHIHPVLGSDGHFTIDQTFRRAGLYHAYADGEPDSLGQQVFRFDFPVGVATASSARSVPPAGRTVNAGPYTVTLSTTTVSSLKPTNVTVHIRRAGKPAGDLHPYLGALAHAVFLNATDLSYLHVHPMPVGSGAMSMPGMNMSNSGSCDMPGMAMPALPDSATSSPDMSLDISVHEPGSYKLWLQFRGGTTLYVAPFAITAT
jgi:hypothetical protein